MNAKHKLLAHIRNKFEEAKINRQLLEIEAQLCSLYQDLGDEAKFDASRAETEALIKETKKLMYEVDTLMDIYRSMDGDELEEPQDLLNLRLYLN